MNQRKMITALLIFFFIFLCGKGFGEGSFQISVPGEISGYQDNPIVVLAPEDGTVLLKIHDEHTVYRVIEKEVSSGKTQIIWDGLGWNEERMAKKSFVIDGTFSGVSGITLTCSAMIQVGPAQQAILFALPSDPTVYLSDAGDWFLEFKILYTDQLVSEFYDAESDELILKSSHQSKGARVNHISYYALTGRKKLPEGKYRVSVYGQRHPSYAREFMLEVREGKRPVLSLEVTGDIMPSREDSDQEIWEKMIAPATVININNTSHQKVFEKPDQESRVLGTLHGQSQAVSVLEIRDKWVRISAWNHEDGSPVEGWVPRRVLMVVRPQTEYGLLVDKKYQTLTVYHQGKKIDTLLVSTGRMAKGELYQETAAGSFLTDYHMSDYSTNGLKYDFVIRYDGGNLLHQIPYAWNESGKKDMIPGEVYLGTKASHACIRVQEKPSGQGINAYWFWTHLPYHTRIIVLDDPEERTSLQRIITGNTPNLLEGLEKAWLVETGEEDEEHITITFGGDVVLGGREAYYGLEDGLPAYLRKKGMGWPFAALQSLFSKDDLTVVNLECVLKDDGRNEDITKAWRFRGLTEYVQALEEGHIDLVNIANNHTVDYGEEGYRSTLQTLEDRIPYCGNGYNIILEIGGHLFGFGGCRETNYCLNPDIIGTDIRELKEKGAEYIIYQCHWGTEYEENHNALQEAMARACYRAGADLVVGHHPHVVQGVDWIDGMPVVYSLGNLVFGGTLRLTTYDAMLLQVKIYPEREDHQMELNLIPVLTSSSSGSRVNDYQPMIALDTDALRVLQQVQKDTPFLLTDRMRVNY